jgi:hypothetical protein
MSGVRYILGWIFVGILITVVVVSMLGASV